MGCGINAGCLAAERGAASPFDQLHIERAQSVPDNWPCVMLFDSVTSLSAQTTAELSVTKYLNHRVGEALRVVPDQDVATIYSVEALASN